MKIIVGFFGGFCGAALLWILLVMGQLGNATPDSQWVRQAYAYKRALSEKISGPKIVIVGGSAALFSINSIALQERYHRPVINLGVNAGVSLPYILEQAKAVLTPGDTALLPLEYPLYNYNYTINPVMVDFYLSEPGLLAKQAWQLQLKLLFAVTPERLIQGYRGIPRGFSVQGLYGPHHMNAHGDQTHSEVARQSENQKAIVNSLTPRYHGKNFSKKNEAWNLLTAFQHWADSRNICLIFIPPSFLFQQAYITDPVENHFYTTLPALARKKGLTYLGRPLEYMFPPDYYFDTPYHLTAEARQIYTTRIIELIGPIMNKEIIHSHVQRIPGSGYRF
ncbi:MULTISPECIES: hypothetical protein [Desulfobacter]|jgi:hypothetical protein|uniref:hypothetical protein n=1 Tax=Desulfobacter TaxID=2289 RepID=UPI001B65376C|nr:MULTISPECIES: hypothetical protein [Desulfobacter]MBP8829411.1 hypothetical protein [Desulfobacter sp.]MDX9963572.1 hypothetical protein [Desulfobacter postgatei]